MQEFDIFYIHIAVRMELAIFPHLGSIWFWFGSAIKLNTAIITVIIMTIIMMTIIIITA